MTRRRRGRWVAAALAVVLPAGLLAAAPVAADEPAPVAGFDWAMPERFVDVDDDGLPEAFTPTMECDDGTAASCEAIPDTNPNPLHPDGWRVTLDACASTPNDDAALSWRVPGTGVTVEHPRAGCAGYEATFPSEGTYRVELTVAGGTGSTTITRDVVVQDWLVVSLGDSYGSGEGNPDEPVLASELDAAAGLRADLLDALADLADLGPCSPTSFGYDDCADALDEMGHEAIDRSVDLIKRLNDPVCNLLHEDFDFGACLDLVGEFISGAIDDLGAAVSALLSEYRDKFEQAYADAVELVEDLQAVVDEFSLEAHWTDRRCHRSGYAGSAQAARLLEMADPRTSVTFIHLACSGAEIVNGIIGSYDGVSDASLPFDLGIEPEAKALPPLDPQVIAARELIGDREVDALYLSIGGNDAGFGDIVVACIVYAPCNPAYQGAADPPPLDPAVKVTACAAVIAVLAATPAALLAWLCPLVFDAFTAGVMGDSGEAIFDERVKGLPVPADPADWRMNDLYDDLDVAVHGPVVAGESRLGLPESARGRVYISEYVDATRNDDLGYCPDDGRPADNMPGGDVGENEWLDLVLERTLNGVIADQAEAKGWNIVDGVHAAFQGHGLCAEDNWMVRLHDSILTEGKVVGAVHPNRKGHAAYRNRILGAWVSDLYPDAAGGELDIPGTQFSSYDPTRPGSVLDLARDWVADHATSTRRPQRPPVADAGGPYTIDEGEMVVAFNDTYDGEGDAMTFSWSAPAGSVRITDPDDATPWLRGLDDAAGPLEVTVTDDDGSSTDQARLVVRNVAPRLSLPAALDAAEGTPFATTAGFTDPGAADTHTATVDYGDGTVEGPFAVTTSGGVALAHTWPDNGSFAVTVTVTDDDGGTDTATTTVTVANVAPTVAALVAPLDPVLIGTLVTASSSFEDPGTDTYTAQWSWGDGSADAGPVAEGAVAATHTYATPGIYTVMLTVTDDDGGAGSASFLYVVVYDPDGGFATGGGTIESPPGAMPANPTAEGIAHFAFVSKYAKGATVPAGTTSFRFNAGGFDFASTSYQWLVIAGARAQYKGAGTVNGVPGFGFILAAIDGDRASPASPDRLRLKVWDVATGTVVYDNQLGDADDALASTAIEHGQVMVHGPKR